VEAHSAGEALRASPGWSGAGVGIAWAHLANHHDEAHQRNRTRRFQRFYFYESIDRYNVLLCIGRNDRNLAGFANITHGKTDIITSISWLFARLSLVNFCNFDTCFDRIRPDRRHHRCRG
jgi:hypothetical protein